jgi:cytochrome c-type biogenesis protein CcmH/NrfG
VNNFALVLALLLPAAQQDRTRVQAELSQSAVRVGETVLLAITVETPSNADIQITPPQLPRTIVVVGSQESTQMQFAIPGGRRRVVTRELVLQPASQGTFTIPAINIEVGGAAYRTRPLTLTVSGAGAANPSLASDEAWLRVSMTPATVYVGQQTTLNVEAGFSEEVRLRLTRAPIFDTPAPTGFWVHEIPGGVRSQLREVDGGVVEIHTKKIAYFPLNAGRYALKQSRAILDVRQGFLYAPETREIRSSSPRVTVLPLPEAGKPPTFRGAVGQYNMQASVEPLTVAAGEPVQIKLVISGTGNIKALAPPALPQVLGAEVFAPTEESITNVAGETVGGTKTFTYVLIPENEGVLKVPAIIFPYFDPVARTYRMVRADPVDVRVQPGGAHTESEPAPTGIRPLRTRSSPASLQWVRSAPFALAQLLPLLALAVLVGARRRTPRVNRLDEYRARTRKAAELADDAVYRELDHIVRDAMRDPTGARHVAKRGGARLLERINTARFAPVAPAASEKAAIIRETEAFLNTLFEPRTRKAAPVVLLLVLAQQPVAQGVQQFEAGDYQAAVASFQQQTQAVPSDASAWYNLGNAYHRAGERGRALWAWANVLMLEPRSRDVVHNLRAAGNVEALRVRPPMAVRAEEWLLLAALLWWTAAGFGILALARKRRLSPWLIAPLVLAAIFAVIGVVAMKTPRYVLVIDEQTALHAEPTIRSPLFRRVRAGAVLTVQEERAEWLRVRTIDRREAWIARDDAAEIRPTD